MQLGFQRGDLPRYGGLGECQLIRRSSEAAQSGNTRKRLYVPQLHSRVSMHETHDENEIISFALYLAPGIQ